MIIWISRTLALAIHDRQLAEHGGGTGVRDDGLFEAALARPQQRHAYGDPPPDLADLAASLAFALARNHPFIDGNKRTAHVCYRVFLRLNGGDLAASDEEKYAMTLGLAEGSISETEFADWLRPRIGMTATGKVQEPPARYAR
ncbi:type II toxin-antitoxin system death-on-curing family toxin [Pseudoxanthomonas sp. PXM01]|uniref:type II toxin-antitoxin system death-on-curing family toxin n=1 Tax=Pseudoxanthomonas sp. PXM01 TaxID=2769295 RepID=UPI00177C709E|nr:type II toxin-antitoxin system death-on-curing family toxin [Pseudoxanthomonas sp. PXM01]MBD9469466.1 type II toxin-antitoxin system death-on-curing family toxin [Pseudoxanthomonas sp. PXM01]